MLANNNLKVCWTLVKRDFRFHRAKNLILSLAAMLVTALYTFVFLMGSSVQDAFLLNYQYTYGSTSHILYTGLTEHQADLLSQHVNVKSTVRLSTLGQLSDPMIGQRSVKLAVTDQAYAETVLSLPTTGSLPEQAGQIALDELTMNSLGVPHQLGAPVTLQWTDPQGEQHTDQFTLCGWWYSPTNFSEACAWVSAETATQLMPGYDSENAAGITLGVTLYQPRELEQQAQQILQDQGLPQLQFTTNLSYNSARLDQAQQQALPFYSPAILVLVCGYLMIYSIVHVAAQRDTLFFASLKSLGMTPRQIRRMLLEQSCAVTLLGLIPGWALGFGLHFCITSRVITGMEQNPALYFLSWQPFVVAALCTLLTALVAYLLPTWRLARMTPAQAVQSVSPASSRLGRSSDGRTTLLRLALRTLGRNAGRMALSAVSLLLAVVLLNAQWISYISYKEDIYLQAMSPWDYSIADGSAYLSVLRYNESNRAITEEMVEALSARPEVSSVSGLKSRELTLTAPDSLRQRIVDYYNQPYDATMTLRDTQAAYPDWCAGLDRLEQTGQYTALVIGLEGEYLNYVLQNCPFTSGSFDRELFESGDYVLAAGAYHEGVSTPAEGETVALAGTDFTVLGSVMHDNAYLSGSNSTEAAFSIAYLLPLEAFDRLFPDQAYRQLAVNIDHSQQESFEEYLTEYEQGLNFGIGITRRSEYQQNFEASRLNAVLPEVIIGLVLLGIALINFVNMLVVKTVSRKGEFAVYESLGMTRAQLRQLMLLEGGLHAAAMALVLIPLTLLFDLLVMPGVVEAISSWCMVYTFSAAPLWAVLPVVLALAALVPLLCLHFVTRGTIQERLCGEE